MEDTDKSDEGKVVRMGWTVSEEDADRLRRAALDVGTPAAVLARALVLYGLDHMSDPPIAASVADAVEAEKVRRAAAASVGGKRGSQARAAAKRADSGAE